MVVNCPSVVYQTQVEVNPTFKNSKTASRPSPSCSQFHLYYDTTEEQYSLSENHHGLKTKPLERASVLRTPCSQLINKEQMNSRKRWVTHMQGIGTAQTYSHQTEERTKMLPSSSSHDIAAGPSRLDEEVASAIRRQADPVRTQIGIYGWRKRCLFVLILVLILIVVFNLCLTLWFMEVLQFSSDGIGTLKIVKGGVVLNGRAYFMDTLVVSSVSSRHGRPLTFVTSHNLSMSVRNSKGREVSSFLLQNSTVKFTTPTFNITGPHGEILFSANKKEVVFGTGEVRFTGHAGAVFDSSIQTPMIRGHYKRDLSIESVTRMIEIFGPAGVVLDSRAGDISVSCLTDLKFESTVGSIKLDGSKLYLPRLQTANAIREGAPEKSRNVTVYQVCVCSNGKLFLSPSDGECVAFDNDTCR